MSDADVKYDPAIGERILQMRNDGAKWSEISESLELPGGKVILYFQIAALPKSKRIKNPQPADVVRLRDQENLSWGMIVAHTMIPESRLRAIYEEETKTSTKGNRIGKGGRYPTGAERPEPAEKKAPAAKGKKAPAPAKSEEPRSEEAGKLDTMEPEAIKSHLPQRAIKVKNAKGGLDVVKIAAVKSVKNGVVVVQDHETGKAKTVKIANIWAVTKGKIKF